MGFREHADSKRLDVVLQLPPDTEARVHKIRWLAELGVPTIHLSIGAEPLSVEASRVCVLTDPADGLDVIAEHTVEALSATRPSRAAA